MAPDGNIQVAPNVFIALWNTAYADIKLWADKTWFEGAILEHTNRTTLFNCAPMDPMNIWKVLA